MDVTPFRQVIRGLSGIAQLPLKADVAQVAAGDRRRVHRYQAGITATIAAAAVLPAVTGLTAGRAAAGLPAGAQALARGPVAYVDSGQDTVIPIRTATGTAGRPIRVAGTGPIAVTPDGRTVYVASERPHGVVTPISTAANKAGKPIRAGDFPGWLTVTPNGKIVYVANIDSDNVTAISTATNTVVKTIKVGDGPLQMAITPDGSTVYTANPGYGGTANSVTVISTAANTVVKTIRRCPGPGLTDGEPVFAVTPDSKTAYLICNRPLNAGTVLPIRTATHKAGKLIKAGPEPQAIVITPDGKTGYVGDYAGTVIPFSTATNAPGKPVKAGNGITSIAITPDGKTAYVVSYASGKVTPISTATNKAGKPIKVKNPYLIAITPGS
jgi:YVTN family beta-propeller protein